MDHVSSNRGFCSVHVGQLLLLEMASRPLLVLVLVVVLIIVVVTIVVGTSGVRVVVAVILLPRVSRTRGLCGDRGESSGRLGDMGQHRGVKIDAMVVLEAVPATATPGGDRGGWLVLLRVPTLVRVATGTARRDALFQLDVLYRVHELVRARVRVVRGRVLGCLGMNRTVYGMMWEVVIVIRCIPCMRSCHLLLGS